VTAWSEQPLFELENVPPPSSTEISKLSPDRARTERRKLMLERGQHPTGNGEINLEHNCRECIHCIAHGWQRTYYKCDVSALGERRSAASDIRLSWPACPEFDPR
jgi:hypothetical protein